MDVSTASRNITSLNGRTIIVYSQERHFGLECSAIKLAVNLRSCHEWRSLPPNSKKQEGKVISLLWQLPKLNNIASDKPFLLGDKTRRPRCTLTSWGHLWLVEKLLRVMQWPGLYTWEYHPPHRAGEESPQAGTKVIWCVHTYMWLLWGTQLWLQRAKNDFSIWRGDSAAWGGTHGSIKMNWSDQIGLLVTSKGHPAALSYQGCIGMYTIWISLNQTKNMFWL